MKQAITYKDIALSLGKIISIEQLEIRQGPNQHGELYLSVILDSEEDEMAFYDLPDTLTLTYEQEGRQRIFFKGIIRNSRMKRLGQHMAVTLKAYDMTYILDTKRRTRSFQNISRTSHSVIEEVMKDYPGCICTPNIPNEKIGQIWFQYEETDWEFLCRFASHYGERLYADATYGNARFQAGLSAERIEVDWGDHPYRMGKDFKRYAWLSQNGFPDLELNQFVSYIVESYELYTLGSQLAYQVGQWFIERLTRTLKEGLLVCTYELLQQSAMLTPKQYNRRISGISIDGKVVQINRDKVRVSLNVDTSKEQGTYWFPFSTMAATADGSGWYSMPEQGDSIRVYFPTKDEKEGYVITKHDSHTPSCQSNPSTQAASVSVGHTSGESAYGGNASGGGYAGDSYSGEYSGGSSGGGFAGGAIVAAATTGMASDGAMALNAALEEDKEAENALKKENPMDDPEKRNIFTQDGNMVQLIPSGVFLSAGASRIALYKGGKIVFKAPAGITINAGKQLYISGANVTLQASNIIRIDSEKGADIKMTKTKMTLKAKKIYEN